MELDAHSSQGAWCGGVPSRSSCQGLNANPLVLVQSPPRNRVQLVSSSHAECHDSPVFAVSKSHSIAGRSTRCLTQTCSKDYQVLPRYSYIQLQTARENWPPELDILFETTINCIIEPPEFPQVSSLSSNGYESIPINTIFRGLFTSINPSYFDVNKKGVLLVLTHYPQISMIYAWYSHDIAKVLTLIILKYLVFHTVPPHYPHYPQISSNILKYLVFHSLKYLVFHTVPELIPQNV